MNRDDHLRRRVDHPRGIAPTVLDGGDGRADVRRDIAALYLPAYRPDLNPIENAFPELKRVVRSAAERTVEGLWAAVGRLQVAADDPLLVRVPHRPADLYEQLEPRVDCQPLGVAVLVERHRGPTP